MRTLLLLATVLTTVANSFCQKNSKTPKLGQTTKAELAMLTYKKDSTANALVLEEKGYVYVDKDHDYNFRRDIYKRIKIFNKEGNKQATVKINLFGKEKVAYIDARTYNLEENKVKRIYLLKDKIFTKQLSESWQQVSFTLPNVKKGTVIEYKYSLFSPYYKIDDWNFQSDIPKLKSDFITIIPGNYKYNFRHRSYRKLDRNKSYIKRHCISYDNVGVGDCIAQEFGMDSIAAFKKENYMLSKKNYIPKVLIEPVSLTTLTGTIRKFTTTWKHADKTLRNQFFDKQTSKKKYFKKVLPKHILAISDPLEKAKAVYKHLQKRLFWNEKYWTRKKIKVKQVYQERSGGVDGINLTLFNALQAADIESNLVALSTRNNGQLTKLYPSITEFNYIIVRAVINNKSYFLDATGKLLAFGEVPFRTLNGDARILDFDKGGYWQEVVSLYKTTARNKIRLKFNKENELEAEITRKETGYYALDKRKALYNRSNDQYLEDFETKHPNLEVNEFKVQENNDKLVNTFFKATVTNVEEINDRIRFSPFIIDKRSENPFKLKHRYYPINFGHTWSHIYIIVIAAPNNYKLSKIPQNKKYLIPSGGGIVDYKVHRFGENLQITMGIQLRKTTYSSSEYKKLKRFFQEIISAQNSIVEYQKKTK